MVQRRTIKDADAVPAPPLNRPVAVPGVRQEALVEAAAAANDAFIDGLLNGDLSASTALLPRSVVSALRALDSTGRRRVCRLPFTLYSLRYADSAFWSRLFAGAPASPVRSGATALGRTGVFLAWHLVNAGPAAATLTLGMSPEVAGMFRRWPLSRLDEVGSLAGAALLPRWPAHAGFWKRIIAIDGTRETFDRARYLGLQLLAAEFVGETSARSVQRSRRKTRSSG